MLPSADQLFKDADFIFQQDLAPAHTAKSTKRWLNDHGVGVLDWPANSPDLNIENLWGIVKKKMRNKRPKKCRWAEGHCQRSLGFHTTSAVPQTDHLHATPNWGSNSSKRSPYQVLSTYTVIEHTFQKTNNSLEKCFIGLMKYSN